MWRAAAAPINCGSQSHFTPPDLDPEIGEFKDQQIGVIVSHEGAFVFPAFEGELDAFRINFSGCKYKADVNPIFFNPFLQKLKEPVVHAFKGILLIRHACIGRHAVIGCELIHIEVEVLSSVHGFFNSPRHIYISFFRYPHIFSSWQWLKNPYRDGNFSNGVESCNCMDELSITCNIQTHPKRASRYSA
ncbi:hypothetical protein [Methanobrevibacter sp.]|uniref:hypothetical protein n=1 Tax=Methanobrevibacter sp. TaxID=66852 RepID=UPI003890A0E4